MEQNDEEFSTTDQEIEDIDKLATSPPQKVKPYQEDFIEEKLSKRRIAESQESTRGRLAIAFIN